MKKILKKWGPRGLGIYISKDESIIYDVKDGDFIEITMRKLEKKELDEIPENIKANVEALSKVEEVENEKETV